MLTQAEIFADLKRRRYEAEEEGWTVAEYAANLGISNITALRQITNGVAAGTIKPVGRRRFVNDNGRTVWSPVYLFNARPIENQAPDNRKKTGTASVARALPRRRDG